MRSIFFKLLFLSLLFAVVVEDNTLVYSTASTVIDLAAKVTKPLADPPSVKKECDCDNTFPPPEYTPVEVGWLQRG